MSTDTAALVGAWLGALIAVGAVVRGLWRMVSALVRLVDSTENNTKALQSVTATLASLTLRVDTIERGGRPHPGRDPRPRRR